MKEEKKQNNQPQEKILHKFDSSQSKPLFTGKLFMIFIIVILVGVGSGYLLSKNSGKITSNSTGQTQNSDSSSIQKGTTIGSDDTTTFKDSTEGVLKEGGIDGEGQFHLVRPGGDSQNVYLISSIVDLSKIVDKKIKVWGQTQTAKTAGWLMDVGRVEVLE